MDNPNDSDELLIRVREGDTSAVNALMELHRPRLKTLVIHRMDQRLASRVDPSDIVQEALADASQKLYQFVDGDNNLFYPWLRTIAVNRLVDAHRRHIQAQRRTVDREAHSIANLSEHGQSALIARLAGSAESPSQQLARDEQRASVRTALSRLAEMDREVLILRFLEQLSTPEAAAIQGVSENTFAQRLLRALRRLQRLMKESGEDLS